ncbi:GGDEF domain-containing protein [Telluria mixta]|uniref:diguanylate cyclase n=1 Tax=Telluria mixta TaxID=34071 RepID=A0ABT2C772_9BURK|nr:GGDEF domain-containing protein [Telluria mixta]MCS0633243.1 GGDEF domain-containing protein [Telluria mixta]WEM94726.1 GGDEF domain-containing protein [Telluria mixta]
MKRRALAALLALGLGAPGAHAAAEPGQLARLDGLVRSADAGALPALLAAQNAQMAAAYPERIAYLHLLRRAYADRGDTAAAGEAAERIVRMAQAEHDALNKALGQLARADAAAGHGKTGMLAAVNDIDIRNADLRDPAFTAALQQAYGDAYVKLGQFDFAHSHYLKAQEIARQHPDLLDPTVNGLRLAIAKVYVYTRAADKVLSTLAAIGPDGGALPPSSAVRRFVIEGIAHVMQGHPDRGRVAYYKGLQIAHANGLTLLEANALGNIADSWLEDGNYVEAERAARAALPLALRAGDPATRRIAEANLGFALAGQGHVADGLVYVDRVVAEERADGSQPDLANMLIEKSRMLEKAGQVRQALQALQEHHQVAAKLAAAEHENTARVLHEQFEAQRRAIQIESLRRENAMKDAQIRKRRVWQLIATAGAGLALVLCGFVWRLYRRSVRTSARLRELNEELAFHSTHDALTGLLNRRSFRDAMVARTPGPGRCFILLDIDHFKTINDRLGHAAGDEVLVEVARRLRAAVDGRSTVLRWGGEEFLVHADGGGAAGHADLVRTLLAAVADTPVTTADGQRLAVTITAGALSLPAGGDDAIDWQHALALADAALYRGKQDGRRCAWLDVADATGAVTASRRLAPESVRRQDEQLQA